ncbi:MAG: DUF2924 domain-containing protein [Alphaproteobacteria bacterium]|jgi:hypothetical protein|nr:DUF2924 domain-containing protein [Alphaproteobacteria bacterium]MBT4084211.1 DUF2924 domain-containing protein [Alphaproteobacteria bacterium]MBT4543550.1 DUF2924 domain-containing protein [Alphaproteobacteria bacterium]MBT5919151.1 DUF2924 domain-containing protein [Alphaproteobacteria bacterium]MBT7745724.1 DUF2924 domain-containing protein [Alphaproteobacteria bacterium]
MTDNSIEHIAEMKRADLVSLWKKLLPEPPPPRLSISFLRRILAFEIQSHERAGLPRGFMNKLSKSVSTAPPRWSRAEPRPGGRLLREWNGITHVVEIAEGHYFWNKEQYRSLSAIARAITGAHWSGPRFFGLNKAAAS